MAAQTIDIIQKLSDFKKSYDDSYNRTSAIFNNHVKSNEPSVRLNNNSNNPNIEPNLVKPEPGKTEPGKTNLNSRIIDLNSDKGFTTNPPSRISIKYTQKRLANRRKRLIQRRSRPRNHIKIKK